MAKFTYILTLLLITFSFATISKAEPENDAIDIDISTKKTLLLPSNNQEPKETTTTVGFSEILPENDETKANEVSADLPIKVIRFHPINHRFPKSRFGSLRVPLRRCRHGGMGEKPMRPRQVSLSDDMMLGENGDFDPMVRVVHQVPEQWFRIHRHHPHHFHHHRRDGMPGFPMGKHHDFFADKRFQEDREEKREKRFPMGKYHDFLADRSYGKREETRDMGFMRSIRKFLNGRF